jgi:hypothetical protein
MTANDQGESMGDGYRDVKAAASQKHKDVWSSWFFGGVLWVGLTWYFLDTGFWGWFFLFGLPITGLISTFFAVRASWRVSGRVIEAQRRALEED